MEQINVFDMLYKKYKPKKSIKLIELFAGVGSQSQALKYLGITHSNHKIIEWAIPSIIAYYQMHSKDKKDYSKLLNKEEIANFLFKKGVSKDYNSPATLEQIKRIKEETLRECYNAIISTNNLVNIMTTKGDDLEIENNDEYEYIMTYSFPCQDLSLAGNRKGMSKDSETRSGLLWEVERLLKETKELPQILLMENVPQVIGQENIKDFNEWQHFLEELGYKNYTQNLIATDYSIPQIRNRTFMISILGDYSYNFPGKLDLKYKLKDFLEKKVDESYYLSSKQIEDVQNWNAYQKPLKDIEKEKEVSPTLTTRTGAYAAGMVLINEKQKMCNNLIVNKQVKENDVIKHSYNNEISKGNKKCVEMNNLMPTMTTRPDCLGVVVNHLFIKENTKNGYAKANDGDGVYINRPHQKRGVVQKGKIQTIKTSCDDLGVVEFGTYYTWKDKKGNINTQCNRAANEEKSALTIACSETGKVFENKLRIRKLTTKECFRLMGWKDEDYEKLKLSKNQKYHIAGDSIVTTVLMAIFGKLFDIDYETKINDLTEEIKENK